MKGKKGKKTPSPTPKKEERPPETPKEQVPETTPLDGQMLTLSDSNILNPNQILGIKDKPDSLFTADDASTVDGEEAEVINKKGVLTTEVISQALSNVGISACGTMQVFLHVSLPGYGLTDISALNSFVHLQKVDLSYNQLTDLSALSNITHLINLNVSHNQLESLLDFTAPFGLKEADFSHNQINEMPSLDAYDHLVTLKLDNNNIGKIEGLFNCKSLLTLTLSHNKIEKISGLDNLNLRKLSLGYNLISLIENLDMVPKLQEVDLSGNSIFNLNGLSNLLHLHSLDVGENQILDLTEIHHIDHIKSLRILNFTGNSIVTAEEYRKSVIFAMQQLTELDHQPVTVHEKVAAVNLFNPPPEVQAALDHITHTVYRFLQPSKIYESTLPSIEMPYPMLVLTGPQSCGKRELAHKLAQEFPDYFGFGISHTTRVPYPGEQDGRDYHFVTPDQFQALVRQGCFLQTFKHAGCMYGLTLDAIESVAKEGLACVVHMEINGIRTLRNTYFEPRYVLIIPTSLDSHKERLMERGVYSEEQMEYILHEQCDNYKEINQQYPGFFDMVINNNKLAEAYDRLRQLVMDYLGTSDLTTADGEIVQPRLSTMEHKDETSTHHTTLSANMRRTWSRPSYQGDSSTNDQTSAQNRAKLESRKTPVEEASFKRRQDAAKEAIHGYSPSVYEELFRRPMVPMTAPGMLEGSPMAQATSMYQDPSFTIALYPTMNNDNIAERVVQQVKGISNDTQTRSSTPDSSNPSQVPSSGLSGLSSARGFSAQASNRKEIDKNPIIKPNENASEQPLDLTALSDALESLKGSLKDSSRTNTPLAPRLVQGLDEWLSTDVNTADKFGSNAKPVLPPIPTGGR